MTWGAALAALALSALLPVAARAETLGKVTEYPLPPGTSAQAITNGPSGLWMTLHGANAVARMSTAGGITLFQLPTRNAGPDQITAGPDGNVWFTEQSGNRIGRVTPDGIVTEFPTPTAGPAGITPGPDGNVWFTEAGPPARIGRITAAGSIAEFAVPGGEAADILTGPDGNLWYTAPTGDHIGQLNPTTGAATEFLAPGNPTGLADHDATSLWYTQQSGSAMGQITTSGTTSHSPLAANGTLDAIVLDDATNAWFTESNGGIGFITQAQQVTQFPLPAPTRPAGIANGPDHAIWVPETSTNRVARVDTAVSSPAIPPPVEGKTMAGSTVVGTVKVKLPGSKTFTTLGAGEALPVGTIVDTRSGTIQLTATSGAVAYDSDFYDGEFQLAQAKGKGASADLRLVGGRFNGCPTAPHAAAKKGAIRHLWGNGHGSFRTVGRFASALVRGTNWLTQDSCASTLVKVLSGSVLVRDLVRNKNIVVNAGRQYAARAR